MKKETWVQCMDFNGDTLMPNIKGVIMIIPDKVLINYKA